MKTNNSILFDGCATQGTISNKYHGGGEYAKFILRKALKKGKKFDIVFNKTLWTDPEIFELIKDCDNISIIWIDNKHRIYSILRDSNYRRFYSALPYQYSDFDIPGVEFVGVIHGLRPIEFPTDKYSLKYPGSFLSRLKNYFLIKSSFLKNRYIKYRKNKFKKLLNLKNSRFIVVSNHTKYSVLNFFPDIDGSRLKVYYSPIEFPQTKDFIQKEKYFLLCNGNRPEKNIYRAAKVLDQLFSNGKLSDYSVIITGCPQKHLLKYISNKEKFNLVPYVKKEELDLLYAKAACFIYPSLNEGFGYPPLQAMIYKVPVIASSSTSIPEVCGGAALYFDPCSMNDLASRILYFAYDNSIRESLVCAGENRVVYLMERQEKEIEDIINFIFD